MDNLLVCIRNSVSPEMYEDLEKEITRLKVESASWRTLYEDKADKLYKSDITVQNQQQALKEVRKTLELYEKENKAMRELLGLWL
jgi:hypothetical protein